MFSPDRNQFRVTLYTVTQHQLRDRSRDSSVSIVTRLQTEGSGVWFPAEARDFRLLENVQNLSESRPFSYNVTGAVFSGLKRPGYETDRSPLSSAEVKNERSCSLTSPACFHGVRGTQFTSFCISASCRISYANIHIPEYNTK